MRVKIVFEDNNIIVINKPAGMATQTAKVGQADAVSELKNYLARQVSASGKAAGQPYLGVIHRLDQPVEGLLVFAKNKKAAAALTAQLTGNDAGLLNKQYYAVVCGKPSDKEGTLVDKIYKDAGGRAVIVEKGMPTKENEAAKRAVLHYGLLETVGEAGEEISLLDISIETGRFHQIRAQMAHAGMPLLGDAKYGNERSISLSEKVGVRTVALCAYSLALKHPVTGNLQSFQIQPKGSAYSLFEGK